MQRWGDYQRGVFAFDDCWAFDHVPGTQRFVCKNWRGTKIFFWRPVDGALAFACGRGACAFELELRQFDFFCGNYCFQDEAFDEDAAFGVYYEGAESFAEL